MKALVFDLSIPRYLAVKVVGRIVPRRYFGRLGCLSLRDIPMSPLPSEDWALIETEACGICGTDLNMLMGRESFSLEPYSSFPIIPGHESIGRIAKLGRNISGFSEGDRVAADPILSCVTRDIDPPCVQCRGGNYSICENFTGGALSAGIVRGFCASIGGGFGGYFPAHGSQLFSIPNDLPTEAAVLADPLASALQPAADHLPKDSETVLVYGGGIIGILLINSLRALGFKGRIISVARYDFQAELLKRAGANDIITIDLYDSFAGLTGASMKKPTIGRPVFEGGVDIVFDCVGSSDTIDNSLRFLKRQGKLVVVGTAAKLSGVDATPLWFKEVLMTGSAMYSHITIEGKKTRTYQAAIDMIVSRTINTDGLVTHRFGIGEFKKAINTALNKGKNRSIKVVLVPGT